MAKNVPDNAVLIGVQRQVEALPFNLAPLKLQDAQGALKKDPRNVATLFLTGLLQIKLGEYQPGIATLKKALKLHKSSEVILGTLAFVFAQKTSEHNQAIKYLRKKLVFNRNDPQTHMLIASSHLELGEPDRALEVLDGAEKLVTDKARINALKAQCCLRMGDSTGARKHYKIVQELEPSAAFAVADKIAQLPDNTEQDLLALKPQLEKLLIESPQLFRTQEHLAGTYFALGEVCEKLKLYDEAFKHFEAGNKVPKPTPNATRWMDAFKILKETFTPELFKSVQSKGHLSAEQVFIVGMPRSGTTLVESILANHPSARDFGELEFFVRELHTLGVDGISGPTRGNTASFVKTRLMQAPIQGFQELGERYINLHEFQKLPGILKIDKMPQNFLALGLIALVFPNAKIIHCQRHPMDCALSIYRNNLGSYHDNYAFDLAEIGKYYREYVGLMQHWEDVLPIEIHNIRYENVIADPEDVARKMISALGLEWDPACLDHTKAKRDVKTASAWLVRQEIYSSSIQKWRIYEKQLQPLADDLADLVSALDNK